MKKLEVLAFTIITAICSPCFSEDRPATVLIVTADSLAESWKPFAEWKTRLGKSAKIVTVEQIAKNYKGDDVQQKIRACCLEYINKHGTRWVVLGGDSQPGGKGLVPDRDTRHNRHRDIPTDIYYISEGNWDANKDGIYGDWKQDRKTASYTNPKASIGRVPVRTAKDVSAYTAKIIGYETKYPTSDFATKFIYTCPERGAYPKLGTSKDLLSKNWKEGKLMQWFASKTPWDKAAPGDYDLSPDNWVKTINNKTAGKLHMHGHGFLPLWVLEKRQKATAKHVKKLTNENACLTMTTVSCFTGHFDSQTDPCITESMLRHPKGGAVLVIAPSREGTPVFHNPARDFRLMVTQGKMDGTTETMTLFWKYALAGNLSAGEAFGAAKAEIADDAKKTAGYHFVQCELVLLGDPTLDLRAKSPVTPSIDVLKSLSKGNQTVKIKTNAPGAVICLWKGAEVYKVASANNKGAADIEIDCKTGGKLLVTVSGPNLNASLKAIEIK